MGVFGGVILCFVDWDMMGGKWGVKGVGLLYLWFCGNKLKF